MLKRLETTETRYNELGALLSDPKVISDQETFQRYAKEHSCLRDIVDAFTSLKGVEQDVADNEELLRGGDAEIKELAEEELVTLRERKSAL